MMAAKSLLAASLLLFGWSEAFPRRGHEEHARPGWQENRPPEKQFSGFETSLRDDNPPQLTMSVQTSSSDGTLPLPEPMSWYNR